ncbi:hypothetical protein CSUI_003499 [Cystoisospora suis]|uniref:Uncharacterized protein n=1 Tax=Cystoisospora suis TaxID=483139 RepID=A0A2C6L580_9APIC|nr:hypothetical protein CSUI_003499 [Cystoisospora suis]
MDSSRLLRSVDTAWAVVRLLAVLVNQHPLLALPALAEGHAVFGAATHVLGAAYASPQTALGSVDHRTALAEPARIARRRLLALMLSTLLLRIKGPSAQPKTGIQRDRTPGHEVEPGTCKTHENLVVQMAGGEASKAMRVQAVASAWESDEKHCLPEQQGKQIHGERPTLPRKPLWCHSAPGDLQRPPLCFLERELKNPWALSSQLEEIAQYSEQLLTAVTV